MNIDDQKQQRRNGGHQGPDGKLRDFSRNSLNRHHRGIDFFGFSRFGQLQSFGGFFILRPDAEHIQRQLGIQQVHIVLLVGRTVALLNGL